MKKSVLLSVLLVLVLMSVALVQAQDATPEATSEYTQAELDANPYLQSVVTREGDNVRHQRLQEGRPL